MDSRLKKSPGFRRSPSIYKVGMSRGGTTFFNLAAATGCYARSFTNLVGALMIPPSGITKGWIISMIT